MSKQLTNIAKGIIAIISITHLIIANIHVRALLLLENEICGFVMFLFVLVGLVTLFEATRIRKNERKEKIYTALLGFVTSGMGLYLISIYRHAVAMQRGLDVAVVNKAVMLSTGIILAYVVSGILIIVDVITNR